MEVVWVKEKVRDLFERQAELRRKLRAGRALVSKKSGEGRMDSWFRVLRVGERFTLPEALVHGRSAGVRMDGVMRWIEKEIRAGRVVGSGHGGFQRSDARGKRR
jgi:hypothetical protein